MTTPDPLGLAARVEHLEHQRHIHDGRIGAVASAINTVHGTLIAFQEEARESFGAVQARLGQIEGTLAEILDRLPPRG